METSTLPDSSIPIADTTFGMRRWFAHSRMNELDDHGQGHKSDQYG